MDPCLGGPGVTTLLGPLTVSRTAGAPQIDDESFTAPEDGTVCIIVDNDGVASADVVFDDEVVFSSSSFNPHVTILNARRSVDGGHHALSTTVRSKPGTALSIEVRFAPGDVTPGNLVQGANARLEVFDLFDDPDPFAPGDMTGLPTATQLSVTARPLDLPASGSNQHEVLARARFEIASGASCEPVTTLVSERAVAGEVGTLVQAAWDGRDGNGMLVPAGIYYYRATVELVRRHLPSSGEEILDTATTAVQTVFVVDANDPCRQPMAGVEIVAEITITGSPGVVRDVPFDLPEPGILCLTVTNPGATPAERTARANLFIDDRHVLDADLFSPDVERLRFGVRMPNSPHVLRVALEQGSVLVSGRFIATSLASSGPPPAPVTCEGRLRGFEHPFDATVPRPLLARSGVEVHCQANYAVSSSVFVEPDDVKTQLTTIPVRQTGLTDSEGRFNITVSQDALTSIGITTQAALESVVSGCEERPGACGWEARRGVTTDLVPSGVYTELDVTDVLDVAFQDVGARLVTNGSTTADRNDLPVLIHEAIDTSNKQGTRFLVWGLSGKPLDFREFVGDENDVCDLGRASQCLHFTDDCNPSLCADPGSGIRCFGAPGLPALLTAGYDVWLIDHLDGKKDITQIAAQSPALYERIIAYPAPDPDRKIGVIGVSLGGVVARMALKLWEKQAQFAPGGPGLPGVTNFLGGPLRLAETPTDLARDRVGLYVSFDAPHRGARVPRALQAYIHHATEVAKEKAGDLGEELNAPPSVQLMEEFVVGPFSPSAAPPGSSCTTDCFFLDNGKLDSNDCCLTDDHPAHIQSAATQAFADALSASMVDAIDRQADDPFGRLPDGLPDIIPSIAISNGNRSGARNVGTESTFMKVTINVSPGPDKTHTLHTALNQPAGSQWFGICRGGDIEGNIGGGFEATTGKLFGPTGQVFCFAVGLGTGYFLGVPGFVLGELLCHGAGIALGVLMDIELEVDFPMKPQLLPGGGIAPNTGFPTFVRTSSSLLTNAADQLPDTWTDAFWQAESQDHARFDEEHCRFMLYHLDGVLRGDRDGYPACAALDPSLSCLDGGRSPGRLLGAGTCDCQPDDPLSYPGALERFDGVDNDCDGLIDEQGAVLPGPNEFPTTPSALADRLGPQVQAPEVKCIYRLQETSGPARAVVGAGPCPDYFPNGGPLQGVACEGLGPNLSDERCVRYVDDDESFGPSIPDSDLFDVSPGEVRTFMVIWRATRALAPGESVRILGDLDPDSTEQKGWSLSVNGGLFGSILGLTVNGDFIASAGFDFGNWDDGEWHVLGVTIDRGPSRTMTVFADTNGFELDLTGFADIDSSLGVVLGSVSGRISMGEIAYYAVLDAGRGNVSNLLALIE